MLTGTRGSGRNTYFSFVRHNRSLRAARSTEVAYGPVERATVHFLDGRAEAVGVEAIRGSVAEDENPENEKQVRSVAVELPTLVRFPDLRFVDMPGLESALAYNLEETLRSLPNVELALVAVSSDTPLSRHDHELRDRFSLSVQRQDLRRHLAGLFGI
jgi:hypothetical protein